MKEVISDFTRIPVKIWASNLESGARQQAINMANMPCAFHHVGVMPDGHQGYGVPIGGVLALKGAICPNACGVDIGCGMCAVETTLDADALADMEIRREFQNLLKSRMPVGEGHSHQNPQEWDGFEEYKDEVSSAGLGKLSPDLVFPWPNETDRRNLGSLGGGNHFSELQKSVMDSRGKVGKVWLMIHSGSRNLGKRIADHYHKIAKELCARWYVNLPDQDLAFLPTDDEAGQAYIRDMNFALRYARENRKRMMNVMVETLEEICVRHGFGKFQIYQELDVHHNYVAMENHFGENVWVHRKGATSAKKDELGIIPGSMGTASYIVKGLGSEDSFCSCSHGAGRRMSRTDATLNLTVEECDEAMKGIVCERWSKAKSRGKKNKLEGRYDLSEAPGAYKDIEEVIRNEEDLVTPVVRLVPLACLKG